MYLPDTSVNCNTSLNGGGKVGTDTRWKLYLQGSKIKQTENDDNHVYLFLACSQTFSFIFDKSPTVFYVRVIDDR